MRLDAIPLIQTFRLSRDPLCFLNRRAARARGGAFAIRPWPLPELTIFTDPAAVTDMLLEANGFAAGQATQAVLPLLGTQSILALDGDAHRARRRLLQPLFSHAGLEQHESAIRDAMEREVRGWRDGPLQTLPRMRRLMFAIACRFVLGVVDERQIAVLHEAVSALLAARSALGSWAPAPLSKPYEHRRRALDDLLHQHIRSGAGDTESAASRLVANGVSEPTILEELRALLIVGHETSACAGAWALERLAWNPAVQTKLRAAVANDDDGFVTQVAHEVLRTRAPVVDVVRTTRADRTLHGCPLAKGSIAAASPLLLHANEGLWPSPASFTPERFSQTPPHGALIPFGGGERRCLGAQLAMTELTSLLKAASAVVLEPNSASPERQRLLGTAVAPARGGWVVVRR